MLLLLIVLRGLSFIYGSLNYWDVVVSLQAKNIVKCASLYLLYEPSNVRSSLDVKNV